MGDVAIFMGIWSILRPFVIFYGHLVFLAAIWFIFPHFGILYQKIWQPCSNEPLSRAS
jgi:hypothetical protein